MPHFFARPPFIPNRPGAAEMIPAPRQAAPSSDEAFFSSLPLNLTWLTPCHQSRAIFMPYQWLYSDSEMAGLGEISVGIPGTTESVALSRLLRLVPIG
jgi:hypothetical protein